MRPRRSAGASLRDDLYGQLLGSLDDQLTARDEEAGEPDERTIDTVSAEEAKESFAAFPFYVAPHYWMSAPHIELLAKQLEAVERGETKRLMVFMPPRHSKSENVSVYFPPWFLGRNPDKRIILTAYGDSLAAGFSRRARNILDEDGPAVFGIRVADDSSAANRWDIAGRRGGMIAAGIGGPITGKGADVLIIDDPIKNQEEANSPTYREKVWDWYRSTAYTRLEPGGAVIIVVTRWHEDDLAGRLLKQAKDDPKADQWVVLKLPAVAGEDDQLGRQPGRALWPARYDEAALAGIRKNLGSYLWSALYQQHPQPAEGGKFKRSCFRYFHEESGYYVLARPDGQGHVRYAKNDCLVFQTVDAAATEKQASDYFVCATWAVTPRFDLLLLDVFREKAETTKHKEIMRTQYHRWQPVFQAVENKTFGLNILQQMAAEGWPVKPLKADTDKVSRSLPVVARYEVGAVYHRQEAHWLGEYEDELLLFPRGAKDDQVDATSYAGIVLVELSTGVEPESEVYENPDFEVQIDQM